jgi:hypothetical protein
MIKPITVFRTSSGRDFATAQEAQAHELGDAIYCEIKKVLSKDRSLYLDRPMSVYSAAHSLAKDHPEIARKVLEALQ